MLAQRLVRTTAGWLIADCDADRSDTPDQPHRTKSHPAGWHLGRFGFTARPFVVGEMRRAMAIKINNREVILRRRLRL
jgi:hypothetical protein